jgi:hypothetical protein
VAETTFQFDNLVDATEKSQAKSATFRNEPIGGEVQDQCFDMIANMFEKLGGESAIKAFIEKRYPEMKVEESK